MPPSGLNRANPVDWQEKTRYEQSHEPAVSRSAEALPHMSWADRQAAILPYLLPSVPQLVGFASVVLVAVVLAGLGGAIGRRDRLPETDLFVGWGIVACVYTAIGTLLPIGFTMIAAVLMVASIVGYA